MTNWKPPGDKGQDDDSLIEWVLSLTRNRRRRFIFTHPFFSLLLSDSNVSWQTFIQASFRVKSDAKKKLGSDVPKIFCPSLIMYYIYICTYLGCQALFQHVSLHFFGPEFSCRFRSHFAGWNTDKKLCKRAYE